MFSVTAEVALPSNSASVQILADAQHSFLLKLISFNIQDSDSPIASAAFIHVWPTNLSS